MYIFIISAQLTQLAPRKNIHIKKLITRKFVKRYRNVITYLKKIYTLKEYVYSLHERAIVFPV